MRESAEEIKTQIIDSLVEEIDEDQKRIDEQAYIVIWSRRTAGTGHGKVQGLIKLVWLMESIFLVPDVTCIFPNGE